MTKIFDKIKELEANIIRLSEKLEGQKSDNAALLTEQKQLQSTVSARDRRIKELEREAEKYNALTKEKSKIENTILGDLEKEKISYRKLSEEYKLFKTNHANHLKRMAELEKEIENREILLGQSLVKEENLAQKLEKIKLDCSKLVAEHKQLKKDGEHNILKIKEFELKIEQTKAILAQQKTKEEAFVQNVKKEAEKYVRELDKSTEWLNQ